jgi:LAO/AO transport system kinase
MAATNFRNALHFFPMPESGWLPKVLCYSGFYGTGVKEIWDMIYEYIDFVKANGYFDHRRNDQAKYWMYESINEHLKSSFYNNKVVQAQLQQAEQMVLGGQQTSFVAAQNLLDRYFEELRHDHRD